MPVQPTDEESKYFLEIEAEKREQLRKQLAESSRQLQTRRELAAQAHTDDLSLADRLAALGFTRETASTIDVLPLVHTAWADGSIQRAERSAILGLLEARGLAPDSPPFTFITTLLEKQPDPAWLEESLAVLRDLVRDDGQRAQNIIEWCAAVARESGGLFGLRNSISDEERAQIERIAETLGNAAVEAMRKRLD